MSERTVAGEVARIHAPEALIKQSLAEFGRVLPASINRDMFGQWAMNMLSKALASPDPKQMEAWNRVLDPGNGAGLTSVMVALRNCAELGLRPGSEYHLVPFGNTVTGITDYKGEVRLINNWEPCSVVAMLVREKDKFAMTGANIPPKHDADWFGDRGPIVGGYSFIDYGKERYSLVYRLPESTPEGSDADSLQRHRAVAKTKVVWDAWPEQMRLKTLVHGVRKTVSWSAERRW